MLESYETSMNGVLRWVQKRRTAVDGEVYQTEGRSLQPIAKQITPDVIND